jgi:hypothetical protein
MIPRDRSDGQYFLELYKFSDQPYVPGLHWTTDRGWAQDPLYIAPKKHYESDPVAVIMPFILDTTLTSPVMIS